MAKRRSPETARGSRPENQVSIDSPNNKNLSKYANKRTDFQKESDYALIAHLYLRGETQFAIAEKLCAQRDYQISRAQVHQDLKVIQYRWKEAAIRDFDEHKSEQLAKLDILEQEYWGAWEVSKTAHKRITRKMVKKTLEEQSKRQRSDKDFDTTDMHVTTENQCGDPRYLAGVESVIDKRCRIFGIYAPTKINLNDLDMMLARELERVAGNTEEQIDETLASQLPQ